jgi:GrpB-like predicted nucleotidyltransferase (UPF0157 family)
MLARCIPFIQLAGGFVMGALATHLSYSSVKPLETLGYVFWDENPDKTHLRFFKGMPPFGFGRTHQVHIVEAKSGLDQHRRVFRGLLRQDVKTRDAYEALKYKCAMGNPEDREAYTDQKGAFIESALKASGYAEPIVR